MPRICTSDAARSKIRDCFGAINGTDKYIDTSCLCGPNFVFFFRLASATATMMRSAIVHTRDPSVNHKDQRYNNINMHYIMIHNIFK